MFPHLRPMEELPKVRPVTVFCNVKSDLLSVVRILPFMTADCKRRDWHAIRDGILPTVTLRKSPNLCLKSMRLSCFAGSSRMLRNRNKTDITRDQPRLPKGNLSLMWWTVGSFSKHGINSITYREIPVTCFEEQRIPYTSCGFKRNITKQLKLLKSNLQWLSFFV